MSRWFAPLLVEERIITFPVYLLFQASSRRCISLSVSLERAFFSVRKVTKRTVIRCYSWEPLRCSWHEGASVSPVDHYNQPLSLSLSLTRDSDSLFLCIFDIMREGCERGRSSSSLRKDGLRGLEVPRERGNFSRPTRWEGRRRRRRQMLGL